MRVVGEVWGRALQLTPRARIMAAFPPENVRNLTLKSVNFGPNEIKTALSVSIVSNQVQ